jgi:hypothetical protein
VLAAEAKGTDARFWFDGAAYTPDAAARDLKAVWQPLKRDYVEAGYPTLYTASTPRGRALDAMSVAQWIDATVPAAVPSTLGQLLETAYVIEYGAEASEQSALNLIYLMGPSGRDVRASSGRPTRSTRCAAATTCWCSAWRPCWAGRSRPAPRCGRSPPPAADGRSASTDARR